VSSNTTVDPSPPLSKDTPKENPKNATKEEHKKAFLLEAEELMRGARLSLSVLPYEQSAASGVAGREGRRAKEGSRAQAKEGSRAQARKDSKALKAMQQEGPNLGHGMRSRIHWHRLKEDAVRQHGIDVKLSLSEKDGAYNISEVVRGGAAMKNGSIHVSKVVYRLSLVPYYPSMRVTRIDDMYVYDIYICMYMIRNKSYCFCCFYYRWRTAFSASLQPPLSSLSGTTLIP
jgi:hypothetical protein